MSIDFAEPIGTRLDGQWELIYVDQAAGELAQQPRALPPYEDPMKVRGFVGHRRNVSGTLGPMSMLAGRVSGTFAVRGHVDMCCMCCA